jgi:hypothetical protein
MYSTEPSVDAAPARGRAIPSCPRCLSIEIEAVTPITNASFRDAIEAAWSDHWAGRGAPARRFLLRWACVEAINALRDPYECGHCGFGFREGQS